MKLFLTFVISVVLVVGLVYLYKYKMVTSTTQPSQQSKQADPPICDFELRVLAESLDKRPELRYLFRRAAKDNVITRSEEAEILKQINIYDTKNVLDSWKHPLPKIETHVFSKDGNIYYAVKELLVEGNFERYDNKYSFVCRSSDSVKYNQLGTIFVSGFGSSRKCYIAKQGDKTFHSKYYLELYDAIEALVKETR